MAESRLTSGVVTFIPNVHGFIVYSKLYTQDMSLNSELINNVLPAICLTMFILKTTIILIFYSNL